MPRRSDPMPRRSDSDSDSASRSSQADIQTLHRRLGHLNLSNVRKLFPKGSYAETETAPTTCDICIKATAKEDTTMKHFDRSLQNLASAITAIHTAQEWGLRKDDSDPQSKSPCNATGLLPPTKYVGRSYLHSELLACSKPELTKQWYDSLLEYMDR